LRWFETSPCRAAPEGHTSITSTAPHTENSAFYTGASLSVRGTPSSAYLTAIERSPNTVRAYAISLKLWFEFLQHAVICPELSGQRIRG